MEVRFSWDNKDPNPQVMRMHVCERELEADERVRGRQGEREGRERGERVRLADRLIQKI